MAARPKTAIPEILGKIPPTVDKLYINRAVLRPTHRGKVRDTYVLSNDCLLMVATDRISSYDFGMPAFVPGKGAVLTAMHIWWSQRLKGVLATDLVAYGAGIDSYLPAQLRGNPDLQKRAVVVRKLNMIPVEAIARGFLFGSSWKTYQNPAAKRTICGVQLPANMKEGDILEPPFFSPTSKEQHGHDQDISAEGVDRKYPGVRQATLQLYSTARNIAEKCGIIIVDTKLEFGYDRDLIFTLGDEIFTPDSSRLWRREDYEKFRAGGPKPPSYDKQFLRDWLRSQGISEDTVDPTKAADRARINALKIPQEILNKTSELYHEAAQFLFGTDLETFQHTDLGITL